MKKTRMLAASLAFLLLLGSLASCADTGDGKLAETTASDTAAEESGDGIVKDDLPADLSYADEEKNEIVIISRNREGWTEGEIAAEKVDGNIINDAIIGRNKKVEERLGVTINNIAENEHDPTIVVNKVAATVAAGTHDYDIMACACYATLGESLKGTFADLRDTAYMDFDKPWWSKGFNEAIEYRGSQFAATGSMLLSMYRFAFVTVFNKQIFTDNQVPYLYDDVRNKTWTLDRQTELVTLLHKDAGAQGKQDEDTDIFGLVTNDYISVDPYWSSCNVDILKKDADGSYRWVFNTGKLEEVTAKVLKLFYETGGAVYDYKHYGLDDEQIDIRNMFANGGAAMATVRLLEMESDIVREMEAEYGIVPMPKFDEQQAEYKTLLHDQFTVFTILNSVPMDRRDMLSAVLEAMGSESHYTVRPAYYDTTLRSQIAKDPDSAEMLDMIVENIYIDAGIIYTNALSSFHDSFRQIIGSKTNSTTSKYMALSKKVTKNVLPNMLEKLDDLVEKAAGD